MEDSYDIFKFRGSTNKLSLKLNCPTKLNEESGPPSRRTVNNALGVTAVSSSSDSELDSGLSASGDDSGVARRRRYCHCLALCIYTATQYQFSRHNGHKKKMAATRLLTKSKGEDKEGLGGEDLEADTLETPPSKRCCKSTMQY